jgi:putative toxin-antitoxin system antitoxin component (TIGR02293 family)
MAIETVVDLLGGSAVVNHPVRNWNDLVAISRQGLKKRALDHLAARISLTTKVMAFILQVSERTLQRYQQDDTLDSPKSAQLIQLANVFARGFEVFQDEDLFKSWMETPNVALGNVKPIALLDTPFGIQAILDVLGRIEYGVYS